MNETKQKIVKAMYELVAERGYDKASIGRICERVGIQKPSVYYYFKNKEEIFLAVIDTYLYDHDASLQGILQYHTKEDYTRALLAFPRSLIEDMHTDSAWREVMEEADRQSRHTPAVQTKLRQMQEMQKEAIHTALSHGCALGAFAPSFSLRHQTALFVLLLSGLYDSVIYSLPIDGVAAVTRYIEDLFAGQD